MNKNVKVAKELIKLAKSLVAAGAFNEQWYFDYQKNKNIFVIECPLPGMVDDNNTGIKLDNNNAEVTDNESEIISQWLIDMKDVGFRDIRKVMGFCQRIINTTTNETEKSYRQDMYDNKKVEYENYIKNAKQEIIEMNAQVEEAKKRNQEKRNKALEDKERIIKGFVKNHFQLIDAVEDTILTLNMQTIGIRITLQADSKMSEQFIKGAMNWMKSNGAISVTSII